MKHLNLLVQVLVGDALIIWGCEYLPRLVSRPESAQNWIGALMIIAGFLLAARICYIQGRGGVLAGIPLLMFASIWVWNMHYYFDPARGPGKGPSLSFYPSPIVLILTGVFFSVFFRYLYRDRESQPETQASKPLRPAIEASAGPSQESATVGASGKRKSASVRQRPSPWYRLGFLAVSALLGVGVGVLPGVRESERRIEVILTVMILGCVATGLISEKTLVKILPWKSKAE
jgi:hypothetical protein